MSFSFPAFSHRGPRFPTAELPSAPPIPMPTFDENDLADPDTDFDADEITGEDDPDESGDDISSD